MTILEAILKDVQTLDENKAKFKTNLGSKEYIEMYLVALGTGERMEELNRLKVRIAASIMRELNES